MIQLIVLLPSDIMQYQYSHVEVTAIVLIDDS